MEVAQKMSWFLLTGALNEEIYFTSLKYKINYSLSWKLNHSPEKN